MTKESGLAWTTMSVDDSGGTQRDIRNDITHGMQFATPRAVSDVTGIDKSAMERLQLLADASITFNGTFNDGTNASFDVFKTVPSTTVARELTLTVSAQILFVAPLVLMYFTDFSFTRNADGTFDWTAPGVLSNGAVPTWST